MSTDPEALVKEGRIFELPHGIGHGRLRPSGRRDCNRHRHDGVGRQHVDHDPSSGV